jgi:glycosyltransferase involved in cell wall biosynthesis
VPLVKTEHGLPEPIAGSAIRILRDRTYHLADLAAARASAAAVCYVTSDLRAHFRRGHSGLRTAVIPNGVASMNPGDYPCPEEFKSDCFNLAIVGRLERVKGIHLAIEAMASDRVPWDTRLHIIGAGPCDSELRALAAAHNLGDRIAFLGFRRNIFDYIAHCGALLMPSLHEGLPYTLLETMALGTPIVASRVGGLAEVLHDRVTALLVPPNDPASIAQAIRDLHDDPELRLSLGRESRLDQQDKYSLEAMTQAYLALYRTLLN